MIKSGDENQITQSESIHENEKAKLDQACRPTGWVHVEKDIDLTDPKVCKNFCKNYNYFPKQCPSFICC